MTRPTRSGPTGLPADPGGPPRLRVDARWAEYQMRVWRLRRTDYMDYPARVHLETAAICNARCGFCPYPGLERKGARMSDALLAKIIDDLTEIPADLPLQLCPFKVNEPFLDPRLFDLLETINARLPQAKISLTTNATPITEQTLDRLATVRNLAPLWVSFNDHRAAEYEATMRLDHAQTLAILDMIHARSSLPTRIVLARVGDGSDVDEAFCDWVRARYPRFRPNVTPRGDWLGQVDTPIGEVPTAGCVRWFDLSITATGVVAHCCMDGQARWPIGDVREQSVLEIYNSPGFRSLRESAWTRQEREPCSGCTFL